MDEYIIDFINDNAEVWVWCGTDLEKMTELMINVYFSFEKYGGRVRVLYTYVYLDIYDITKQKNKKTKTITINKIYSNK
jgi:hypothetical protein